MPKDLSVGVIGDFSPRNETHTATDLAFRHAAAHLEVRANVEWVPTPSLESCVGERLGRFDAVVCAPGSPYRSMIGALNGVQFCREHDQPFLGTCGGFQHVVIEYARNVMGVKDAEHAEEHPNAPRLFITPLSCSLVGKTEKVRVRPGSRTYGIYGRAETEERFYCGFGLNPSRRMEVEEAGLRPSGFDDVDEVRVLELPDARFFIATLYVPQASSSENHPHPVIQSLLMAAL